ncbi:chemotaxis response regulator protein-glutamate methylesterase [Hahella sp. CCB-MM4]|uniref:protein-glutamate methylesterase/protein-glutamine glutaminase n=1 Tax=Hahella sp. (strain CCB-MM4) TaxID=1926491 RepID=UPI000B9B945E|nr:chemotaxis response regulator protein-glutamate methylesterase [Hahella sp. CCB-MM4]OZG75284.1 chemotaxis response regulator protein-glutamate methylesterase [Hahella sp. CCB-MM4]
MPDFRDKTPDHRYKVLVVDDSALMRRILTEIINQAPDLEVVDTAVDPYQAREKIKQCNPDVLTLDVEMPRMDGITFLRNLMRLRPMPVVMISSLTDQGAQVTLDALETGAIDFITKPRLDLKEGIEEKAAVIIEKIRMAATVSKDKLLRKQQQLQKLQQREKRQDTFAQPTFATTDKLIAIGASTGGLDAIRDVLIGLPTSVPGVVVAQHIPGAFSRSFAERLDRMLPLKVEEAYEGAPITTGRVYIARGDRHLEVVRSGAKYVCQLNDGPLVNRHKPSVGVLFDSVAKAAGKNALGVMLTGMGKDGAEAMLRLKETGASTIAQDEASCVVWGMPGAAVKLGAVGQVLPLNGISDEIIRWAR